LILLVSCGGDPTDHNTEAIEETPKALQDDKLEIKSYIRSGSGDLIEELYQELVDKNPALKKLEDDLDAFRPALNDLSGKFNKYDSKSNSYYHSANDKASAISDSLLKMKIVALLKASNQQYASKTAEIKMKRVPNTFLRFIIVACFYGSFLAPMLVDCMVAIGCT